MATRRDASDDPKPTPPAGGYPRTVLPPVEMAVRKAPDDRRVAATEEAAAGPARIAVFAAHGMGQQIPFQTMDAIASGLLQAAGASGSTPIATRTVKLKDPSGDSAKDLVTQRIEIKSLDANGQPVEIHVYEGYWAPLTEGKLSARDVILFLLSGAFNGIRKWRGPFKRWVFGDIQDLKPSRHTIIHLVTAVLALGSLLLFNAVIAAVALGRYLKVKPGSAPPWPSEPLLAAINSITWYFCVAVGIYGLLILIAIGLNKWLKPGGKRWWILFNDALWWLFLILLGITITAGALVLLAMASESVQSWVTAHTAPAVPWPVMWVVLLGISWAVRQFMIQFVGDVAAYISPQKLDRFYEIRVQIRQWVFNIARAVYSEPSYQRIGIIGHSLGSVVVYDVLNRLLLDDYLNGGTLKVAERTKALVTFGSPLDKVAYFFNLQGHQTTTTREALAASLQPLILDYPLFRKMKWVNVYSPHDIFAGSLDFYDLESDPHFEDMKVDNKEDPDAQIPLVAHTQYWNGTTIYSELYRLL
jgi:hypothetical protein